MDNNVKKKRAARAKAEEEALNRILSWIAGGSLLEFLLMLLNKYCSRNFEGDITSFWKKLLAPEHVIKSHEEKSIVDLMLGIISMVSESRTLESYKVDMRGRGQTQARIDGVSESLEGLSNIIGIKPTQKGTRL